MADELLDQVKNAIGKTNSRSHRDFREAIAAIKSNEEILKGLAPGDPRIDEVKRNIKRSTKIKDSYRPSQDEKTSPEDLAQLWISISEADKKIEDLELCLKYLPLDDPRYEQEETKLNDWNVIRRARKLKYDECRKLLEEDQLHETFYSDQIHDKLHGHINIAPLCLRFIDTQQFQRLRDIKQLGVAHMFYPGAVHSCFEHSLGVYKLATEAVYKLKLHQGAELGIDHLDVEAVQLAGLLHDIGRSPFGHLFGREFLPRVCNRSNWSHKQMSVEMIDHIIDRNHIDIEYPEAIKKAKDMILSRSNFASANSSREKLFLYDIVANGRNGIDVKKFDYIVRDSQACGLRCNFQFQGLTKTMRVLGDEICYRAEDSATIHNLFATQADLHRTVYAHRKVKAIELMVVDALVKANEYLQIASALEDCSRYCTLNDTILNTIETDLSAELDESRELIHRIRRRELYKFCGQYTVEGDKLEHFKDVTALDISSSQKSGSKSFTEEDVAVSNDRTDLTPGRHKALESIHFFKDFRSEKLSMHDDEISRLRPTLNQDMIVQVYSKQPDLVDSIAEAFENFLSNNYGTSTKRQRT